MGEQLRFTALDSWRGICALAVVLFHFPIAGAVRSYPLFSHGYLFVDFFFVLSGFVIATAWESRLGHVDQIWRFLLRRFGRIWPLHAAILAAFVGVSLLQHDLGSDERHSVLAIFTNLALVHGLGMHKDLTWNGPSWSISVEALLYVIFAVLGPVRWRAWAYAALIVTGVLVLTTRAPHGMASTFDYGAFRGFAGFFTGVLLTRLRPLSLGVWGEVAVVAGVGAFVWFNQLTFLAPAVFGAAVFVFAHSRGAITRVLEWPPIAKLGEWSYSTYMVHSAVVAAIWLLAPHLGLSRSGSMLTSPSPVLTGSIAVGYVAAVVAIASVTYSLIETPGRKMFNALATPSGAAAVR